MLEKGAKMLEVLMYLFENYMEQDTTIKMSDDQVNLELQQIGYQEREIYAALHWLQALNQSGSRMKFHHKDAVRYYLPEEIHKLSSEGLGLIAHLEQAGILDGASREMVIDQAMALGSDEITMQKLKWVVLMVLFSQPTHKESLIWMQDFVLHRMEKTH